MMHSQTGLPKWATDWATVVGALFGPVAELLGARVAIIAALMVPPFVISVVHWGRKRPSVYRRRRSISWWLWIFTVLVSLVLFSYQLLGIEIPTLQGSSSRGLNADIDSKPSFTSTTLIPEQTWTRNTKIAPLTLPAATGGDGTLRYSVSPALPEGLSFNATIRQITGRANVAIPSTEFRFTVRDEDGDKATLTFYIIIMSPCSYDSPKRRRSVSIMKDAAGRMHVSDRDDYLEERIPRIEGGILCNELVDLLSLVYSSDRDDLIVRVAGHLQHPLPGSWRKCVTGYGLYFYGT